MTSSALFRACDATLALRQFRLTFWRASQRTITIPHQNFCWLLPDWVRQRVTILWRRMLSIRCNRASAANRWIARARRRRRQAALFVGGRTQSIRYFTAPLQDLGLSESGDGRHCSGVAVARWYGMAWRTFYWTCVSSIFYYVRSIPPFSVPCVVSPPRVGRLVSSGVA